MVTVVGFPLQICAKLPPEVENSNIWQHAVYAKDETLNSYAMQQDLLWRLLHHAFGNHFQMINVMFPLGAFSIHKCTSHVVSPTICHTRRLLLTYTEDVKTKPLCDRLADQLVGKAVESNMSAQTQVALLFVLRDKKKNKENQTKR